ncbi:MAG: imidazoleglycerol-phosphate dehydratase [Synergistaceae bacterium]|nr:imidazoleglycerol-phosphate dehydratase [Synergistaceae bacterium]
MVKISRNTSETQISISMSHPSPSRSGIVNIPCGFLVHMLALMAHRGKLDLSIEATGDMYVDAHHLTEDIGIVMGQAMRELIVSETVNRGRYGWCLLPMDGSLARVALDISGRGGLYWEGDFQSDKCGDFDLELVPEFFRSFCRESRATLHISLLSVDNSHHAAEAVFKGVGVALDMALAQADIDPSTKGEWV